MLGHCDYQPEADSSEEVKRPGQLLERLTCLSSNASEDRVVGGMDRGSVRVWSVLDISLRDMKDHLKQKGGDLAGQDPRRPVPQMLRYLFEQQAKERQLSISPPLLLLYSWMGHSAAVMSVEILQFETKNLRPAEDGLAARRPAFLAMQSMTSSDEMPQSSQSNEDVVENIKLRAGESPKPQTEDGARRLFVDGYGERFGDSDAANRNSGQNWASQNDSSFLLTSSMDRQVHLWTASGLLVGQFGLSVWNISLRDSWSCALTDGVDLPPLQSRPSTAPRGRGRSRNGQMLKEQIRRENAAKARHIMRGSDGQAERAFKLTVREMDAVVERQQELISEREKDPQYVQQGILLQEIMNRHKLADIPAILPHTRKEPKEKPV